MIAIAEIPLNYAVFQLFGEGKTATYFIAFAFGVMIAMMAHTAAHMIIKSRRGKPWWIVSLPLFIVMIGLCWVAGHFRAIYIEEMGTVTKVATFWMAMLNMAVFVAGLAWSLLMTSPIPAEKRAAYKNLYRKVRRLNKQSARLEKVIAERRARYNSDLENVKKKKIRHLKEEGESTDYLAEQKALRELKKEYDEAMACWRASNTAMMERLQMMQSSYRMSIDLSRQLLKQYFSDEDVPQGPPPTLNIPEIFLKAKSASEENLSIKTNGRSLTAVIGFTLLLPLAAMMLSCSVPQQNKHHMAILIDRTEENQNLESLIESPGLLELMEIDTKQIGNSLGYGRLYFGEINSFSINKLRRVELPPMEGDQTPVQRKKDVEKFTLSLEKEMMRLYSSPRGQENTSLYLPILETAQELAKDAEAQKTIIIISDMMENAGGVSFYKTNPEEKNWVKLRQTLSAKADPSVLSEFRIIILYAPRNTEDDRLFRLASRFWQAWFEELGATVEIKGNI